jgi:hypothetical protein
MCSLVNIYKMYLICNFMADVNVQAKTLPEERFISNRS